MTKKMISWLSFMAVFCLIIYSCRTDESIYEKHDRSETDKIEAFSKFESHLPSVNTTGKSSSEYVSYHEPFKEIIQNFMNNNPEYAERFQREAGDIYFDLRSFTYGETTKGLAYPIMKDGIVNAVLIAMVNEKRDWVTFIVLKNSSSEVTSMIAKFQKFYDALGKAKGREQMQEEQIEEVVIVIYQSIPGPSYIYYQPYTDYGSSIGLGSGMSGGPTIHQGGGFYNPSQTSPNPCEKGRNLLDITKANLKPLITNGMYNYINNSSTGEAGIYLKKDNAGNITTEVAPYVADAMLPVKAGGTYYSAVHTHPNSTYPMFSWSDIYTLYTLEMNSSTANSGQSSLLLVCQDDNGVKQTYMIAFENIGTMMENTFNNPENIGCSHDEIKTRMDDLLKIKYDQEANKTNPNYESVFLQFNFGTNIGLYKANNDLTGFSKLQITSNIPNAQVQPINCN